MSVREWRPGVQERALDWCAGERMVTVSVGGRERERESWLNSSACERVATWSTGERERTGSTQVPVREWRPGVQERERELAQLKCL